MVYRLIALCSYICSTPMQREVYMCNKVFIFLFVIVGLALSSNNLVAQQQDPFTCFNAQEIHFPLKDNDFSNSQILVNENNVNALYYLYQDKYTFWYKFIVHKSMTIEFSVAPSNPEDRYRAVGFKSGADDFCDRLITDGVAPMNLFPKPIFNDDESILYKNTIDALAGDTIYISVLSLNDKDCGHFLYIEAQYQSLSMHAIHGPCYNFVFLDTPDFGAAKMVAEDVELDIDLGGELIDEENEKAQNLKGFAALSTVEVQSKKESLVSVGDKLVLNKVFFYNNTYALKPDADIELNQLVDFLKGNPEVRIEVQGHSANDTEEIIPDPNFKGQGREWNFKGSAFELSEERASAVRDYLIQEGIHKKRLSAKGYGDTQKRVPDASTFEEFEQNMRVEILITKE